MDCNRIVQTFALSYLTYTLTESPIAALAIGILRNHDKFDDPLTIVLGGTSLITYVGMKIWDNITPYNINAPIFTFFPGLIVPAKIIFLISNFYLQKNIFNPEGKLSLTLNSKDTLALLLHIPALLAFPNPCLAGLVARLATEFFMFFKRNNPNLLPQNF